MIIAIAVIALFYLVIIPNIKQLFSASVFEQQGSEPGFQEIPKTTGAVSFETHYPAEEYTFVRFG